MSFNVLMNNHFRGCMCIGVGFDPHRTRHVNLYALPNDEVHVGVYDGIDTWIASAAMDPFGLGSAKRLREIADGVVFEIEMGQTDLRYADGTYQKEGGDYNPAGGQPRPGLRTRRRMGGAIHAEPLPMVPVASPLASKMRQSMIPQPVNQMPAREAMAEVGVGSGIPSARVRRVMLKGGPITVKQGEVLEVDLKTGDNRVVKERRRGI